MKYRIVSLGCPKNLVDSEHLAGRLDHAGHALSEDADLVIINTCAFIADACSESIETILEEARKISGNGKRLVVTGCLVDRYGKELPKLLPEVDLFVGRGSCGDIERLVDVNGACLSGDCAAEGSSIECSPRRVLTPAPTTYLKIQEGCNNRCSYCTIPSIRGPLRSLPIDHIEEEFLTLLEKGFREFNIIGQDITSYGRDNGSDIKKLLARLLATKGDFFIRLLYMHPKGIDDALTEMISNDERIVKYFDIPIQHSEDRLLRSMKRGYTKKELGDLFGKIKKEMPDAVLRTTVMVGYPGETEEDFSGLCAFVGEWEFDNLGAFMYSREKGTTAARIKGHVPKSTKKKRYQRIMELQKDISKRRLKRFLGKQTQVIVEAREAGTTTGRTLLQAPDVDGIAFIRGNCAVGEIRQGKIVGTLDYDVMVELGGVNGTDK
ncbi:MAG: Ribosomal protein S12 methylthiotransferase RimO [Syntrophorhabdaceae bacterium PtaU1.Bin034]|nr:MAG: Ribosomal protein S12 methylthiotransferase RimO [Syntrophorhabdaceae bacterium PtaU1.Bin034]